MYQWEGPNDLGQTVQHTVTGYGNHSGQEDWNAQKLKKQMRSCMNGTCNHAALPGSPVNTEPGVPVIRAGQEVYMAASNGGL